MGPLNARRFVPQHGSHTAFKPALYMVYGIYVSDGALGDKPMQVHRTGRTKTGAYENHSPCTAPRNKRQTCLIRAHATAAQT